MSLPPLNRNPYDNILMLHPDGTFLSFIDNKKSRWYIKRNLAEHIDTKTIKLKFSPKGSGESKENEFYRIPRENKCVVCGSTENLTKHHVVPYRYKQHFPSNLKSRSSYDVVSICITDHEKYEVHSTILHKKLLTQHTEKVTEIANHLKEIGKINKSIKTLQRLQHINIDKEKIEFLTNFLKSSLGEQNFLTPVTPKYSYAEVHQIISTNITNYDEFIVMWRKHFVEFANPQFLPKDWIKLIDVVRKANENGHGQSQSCH